MRPLSAAQAIDPAFARTRTVLFQPFRKGRSWKLAATAYLSCFGCLFFPIPLVLLALPWMNNPVVGSRLTHHLILIMIVAVYTAIMWAFFYIGARLEFVLFDIVLFKAEFVAPVWRKYRPQNWRWIGLKVAFGTVLCAATGIPFALWIYRSNSALSVATGQQPLPSYFAHFFFLLFFFTMCAGGLCVLLASLLGDFILPCLALEDSTVSDSFRRFRALFEAEPAQVVYFALLKVAFAVVGIIALELCIFVAEIALAIPLGIIGYLGWQILHRMGPAGAVMIVVGTVLLYLAFTAAMFYFMTFLNGAVATFFTAYGLYFLGGRYPLLGDLLEPPTLYGYPPPPLGPGAP
jgi:hypothetical protein